MFGMGDERKSFKFKKIVCVYKYYKDIGFLSKKYAPSSCISYICYNSSSKIRDLFTKDHIVKEIIGSIIASVYIYAFIFER